MTTLGEFRKATASLPDETEIYMPLGDDEFTWYETRVEHVLPASVLGHPAAILLEAGQCWDGERDLLARFDAQIGHQG